MGRPLMIDFGAEDAREIAKARADVKAAEDSLLLAEAARDAAYRDVWRGDSCVLLGPFILARHAAKKRLQTARDEVKDLERWQGVAPKWQPSPAWVLGVSKRGRPRQELRTADGHIARLAQRFAFAGAPAQFTIEIDGKTQPLGFESEFAAMKGAEELLERLAR
jgi:hypothetical protein